MDKFGSNDVAGLSRNAADNLMIEPRDNDTSLLDIAVVIAKRKKLVSGVAAAATVLAAIASFLMTPVFTARTTILPPQPQQSTAATMLGQLGAFAGGAGAALGIKNPSDVFVGMLRSRTVADALINQFQLVKRYNHKFVSDARKTLESNTKVLAGKDGMITVEVDDVEPRMAAAIANAYIEQLTNLTSVLAVTEAGQRRLFFEKQLIAAKNDLLKAQGTARNALNQGGIAMVDEQGKSMVATTATLRAQIAAKEVQLGAMKTFATDQNPEYLKATRELTALKQQISKIEGYDRARSDNDSPQRGDPGLRSLSLLRDVKYYEVLFDLLAKQYEAARIDEAKDGGLIQVLDKAIEPERKSKPHRSLIVLLTAMAGTLLGVLIAFVLEASQNMLNDARQAARLALLKQHL